MALKVKRMPATTKKRRYVIPKRHVKSLGELTKTINKASNYVASGNRLERIKEIQRGDLKLKKPNEFYGTVLTRIARMQIDLRFIAREGNHLTGGKFSTWVKKEAPPEIEFKLNAIRDIIKSHQKGLRELKELGFRREGRRKKK